MAKISSYRVFKTSNLQSSDETITVPYEIAVADDGRAQARDPQNGDTDYDSLDELLEAYGLDREAFYRDCDSYTVNGELEPAQEAR